MKFINKSYALYIKDTHQIWCRSAKFLRESKFSGSKDQDFTLDFNTRPTFYVQKKPTKFGLNPLTPSKVIVSTARIHVRTARQPGRQTD